MTPPMVQAPAPAEVLPADRSAVAGCGLYMHIPFCETKCGYCDFYSVALKDRNTAPLVDAVIGELELRLAAATLPISTVFCGGGTPTLLPFAQLQRLLEAIREQIVNRQSSIDSLQEFTVEANPATVDDNKAALLVASGVTRVSMGAQSFFPNELATLERLHSPDDIAPSVETLRRYGVGQLNLDLIFGIPGQTPGTWRESLRRAIDLGPDHIACYGLTYEPATRLTAQRETGRVTPCDEDLEADMFLLTIDVLEAAGYAQYEISNYAKPGCECRHNLIYWRNQPYVGVGPSAAGCYAGSDAATRRGGQAVRRSDLESVGESKNPKVETKAADCELSIDDCRLERQPDERLRRYKNVPDVAAYTRMMASQGHAEIEAEFVEGETLALELILMQLRLNEGLSVPQFLARTGLDPLHLFEPSLSRLVEQGSLAVRDGHIALTRDGRLIANRVIDELASCVGEQRVSLPLL